MIGAAPNKKMVVGIYSDSYLLHSHGPLATTVHEKEKRIQGSTQGET